ncbi:hypothetical protein LTR84_006002 [Exophiala bonariae]|uniref:SpvB-domain-containing protein n=1 Tax=Exophiala bonariae TaxID=1690606 RepID=A0AAV9N2J5_9EURO|nr:hypothetical protein LTR84_006002 [Exophiala bonariae]
MASKSHRTVNEDVGQGSQPKHWAAKASHSSQTAQEVAQGEIKQNEGPSYAPPSFKTSFTTSGKGGGAVRSLGEKMEVNAANGTLSFSIPVATSDSRSGFQPQLNLSYDSGHGNGPFGFGWGISIPSISRNTSRGIPVYDDEKDVFMLTGLEDLVPLLDGTKLVETVVEEYCVRQYQPRVISDSIRIERWSKLADPEDIHWRTISNQNTTTIYGWTDNSRLVDRSERPARIFSWLSCYSYDSYGNAMSYEYKSENEAGVEANELLWEKNRSSQVRERQRYIKSIKYGNKYPARDPADWDVVIQPTDWMFELIFDYGEHHATFPTTQEEHPWPVRKDQFSRCNIGFEVRSYRLCRRFLMFHHFPDELKRSDSLVSSTNLIYDEEDRGTFLSSVTICGHSAPETGGQAAYITEMMPPIKFEYSTVPSPEELELCSAQTANVLSLPNAGSILAEWVDLNGDGIPGILSRQRDGRMWYQRNCSTLKKSPELEFGAAECLTQQPSFGYKEGYYLEDLGGTGQLDLVCLDAQGRLHGYFERVNSELWADFATFTTIPTEPMISKGLVRTDLTGNGLLDVLRPSDAHHTSWQPCLGKAGFSDYRMVQFTGKDMPRMTSNDNVAVYHADMTGDGLSDLVLISNGDVAYWANLGHGVFGAKTQMAHAPVFDNDFSFNLSRVRLIDVDGSGTADLLYLLPEGGANLYYNLSGNSWSSAVLISSFPQIDQTSSVFALDLLGTGTACLCWSQPSMSAGGQTALRYLDLMGSQKPHLLVKVCNEMGSTTEASYTPSTDFCLQDEAEYKPWTTKLPFPVQCVKEVITTDQITGIKKGVKYRYHDGYFDGEEREFRGFGMVEQINEEIFPLPGAKPFRDSCSMTRTWYNTGSAQPSSRALFSAATTFDRLPAHLKAEDSRQAFRALRGTVYRSEVYDGEGWNTQSVPYTATETSHQIIDIQLCTPQTKHCIFRIAPSETLETVYEGQKRDARVQHEIILAINDYGDVQESAKIKYPRTMLENVPALQAQSLAVIEVAEVDFTNAIYDAKSFRKPIPSCKRTYGLPGVVIPSVLTTEKLKLLLKEQASQSTGRINTGEQRLYFTSTTLDRRLPLGSLELYSIEAQTFDLAFTPEQLHKVATQDPSSRKASSKENLIAEAGYTDLDANGYLWRPSPVYGFRQTLQTKTELEAARTSFYVRNVTKDAFGSVSFVEMDKYKLLCTSMTDSMGNKFSTINDYKTLQPISITDLNMNYQHVTLDCFGCVLGIANQGKNGRGEGESFDDFEQYLPPEDVALFFEQPSEALAKKLLGSASDRIIYDLQRFSRNNSAGKDHSHPAPTAIGYLSRDGPGDSSAFNVRIKIIYLDGSASPFQTFEYCGTDRSRWRFAECVFTNSKKMPVRRHLPIFTDNHRPLPVNEIGGAMFLTLHDALQRQVVEISPDGTWTKVRYLSWSKSEYDAGDTVLEANPASKSGVRSLTAQLLKDISWRSWYEIHTQSADALSALRSCVYYDTPVTTHWDPSGNVLLTAESTNTETHCLSYAHDIKGNVIAEYDSRRRVTSRYEFDSLNNCIYKEYMDGGKNWQILNSLGKAFVSWDSRQIMHRTIHDKLQREIEVWVSEANAPEKLVASAVYGESCPNSTESNLRGQLWKQFDQSGATKMTSYNRRGKCTHKNYQLCQEYKDVVDWKTQVELESKVWQVQMELNYFDEITKTCNANGKWTRKVYNALGERTRVLVASSDADLALSKSWQPFILNSTFSADALPLVIEYGNGTVSSFDYDASSRQLINKRVARQSGKILENTYYTYDCMRRIVRTVNSAEQDVFFRNCRIKPESEYTYDAFGQLIAATGREQIVLASGAGNRLAPYDASTGSSRSKLLSDGIQLCAYLEEYQYDLTGNLTLVKHSPRFDDKIQGWTRRYTYEHPNMLDGSTNSNRLSYTTVSGIEERYKYDGDAGEAGHITSMPGFSSITWGFSRLMSSTSRQNVNDGTPETTYYVYNHKGDRIRKVCERSNALQPVAEGQSIKRTDTIYLDNAEIFFRFSGNGAPASTRTSSHITSTSRFAMIEEDEALDEGPLIRYEVSSSLELDDTGQIVSYEEYAPYGACTFAASGKKVEADRRYRFARYLRDAETGLDLCGDRYYAPWIGRWLSPDPIGSSGGVNLFCYSYNDPVNFKDPTGNEPKEHIPGEPKIQNLKHLSPNSSSTKQTNLYSRLEGFKTSVEEWSQTRTGQTVVTLLSIAVPAVIALSGVGGVVYTAISGASALYKLWGNIHNKTAKTSWKEIIMQELKGGLAAMVIGQIPGMTELVAHAQQALEIAQDPKAFFSSLFSTDYMVGNVANEIRRFMGDLGAGETMVAFVKDVAGFTGDAVGEADVGVLQQLKDHAQDQVEAKIHETVGEIQEKAVGKVTEKLHDVVDAHYSKASNAVFSQIAKVVENHWY